MAQDYGTQITKSMVRQIYDATPNTPENQGVLDSMMRLLTAQNVQPIPYTYNAVYSVAGAASALAAGAVNVPFQVTIQADADFLILNQTYDCNTANAARTANTVPALFGNGQFPYVMPQPKYLQAKATLLVLVSNYDAAAGYNLRLSFNGVKLYSYN